MTREQIEKKAVERFPEPEGIFTFEELDELIDAVKFQRKAYIEGALMAQDNLKEAIELTLESLPEPGK